MNVSSVLQVVQLVLAVITCLGVLWGVVNVVSRNKQEWEKRELDEERRDARIDALEKEMVEIRKDGREIIAIGTTLTALQKEIERVRNRLDSFLDAYAVRPVRDEEAATGG